MSKPNEETKQCFSQRKLYDPPGIRFIDRASGREMKLVMEGHMTGWLVYRHPDGQWVTLRKSTVEDMLAVMAVRQVQPSVAAVLQARIDRFRGACKAIQEALEEAYCKNDREEKAFCLAGQALIRDTHDSSNLPSVEVAVKNAREYLESQGYTVTGPRHNTEPV